MYSIITILIAHSHHHIISLITSFLQNKTFIHIAGTSTSAAGLTSLAIQVQPNIIIADADLKGIHDFRALRKITEQCTNTKVIFVADNGDPKRIVTAITAGCSGYIMRDTKRELYPQVLRHVMEGNIVFCNRNGLVVTSFENKDAIKTESEMLTLSEWKVLVGMHFCLTAEEIAEYTKLSKNTVEFYKKRIYKIVGSSSSTAIDDYFKRNKERYNSL